VDDFMPISGFVQKKKDGTWQMIVQAPPNTMRELKADLGDTGARFLPVCWTTADDGYGVILWEVPRE